MYWSRSGSLLDLIVWLLMFAPAWVGGWLLARHMFHLPPRERLLAGLGIGLLLFIVVANLLGQFLPLNPAFFGASILILLSGAGSAWKVPFRSWFSKQDLQAWPQLVGLVVLLAFFTMINRGLSIFDDYRNLPLVSRLAVGVFPPHFYLNPLQRLAYHYGLLLLAASQVRLGGLFSWSAFDLTKALSLALAVNLAYLWLRRMTRSQVAGILGAGVLLLAGGARWLLLFLPQTNLIQMGQGLQLLGSGADSGANLYTVLSNPWNIVGDGPFPFPFAFVNGIYQPLLFAISGPGALPQMTVVLLLLLAQPRWRAFPGLVFGLLLASLALTAEHLFALVWGGLFLAALIGMVVRRSARQAIHWGWVLVPSALLALLGGGVFTEIIHSWLAPTGAAASASNGFAGFSMRWPPTVVSAHLGALSITRPDQLLIALTEMGPALLLAPWITLRGKKLVRRGQYLPAGLAVGAAVSFIIPLFIRYGVERDISRFSGSALFIWTMMGFPPLWFAFHRTKFIWRGLIASGVSMAVLGGLTLLTVELIAIPHPQFAYFVRGPDALISRRQWDRLEPDAYILDHIAYRAVTLFGRDAGAASDFLYTPLPGWEALLDDPDPALIAQAGYSYFYIDKNWWDKLKPEQRLALQQPCVKKVDEVQVDSDFRWLLDIRACGSP